MLTDVMLLKARKKVNYLESDSEGEEDDEKIFRPGRSSRNKRQKVAVESEDEFKEAADGEEYSDYGWFKARRGTVYKR